MDVVETGVLVDYPRLARRRITVDDYYGMAKAGILGEDDRVELIEGELIAMMPIGSPHSGKVNRLTRLLVMAVGRSGVVTVQNPVRLSNWTEPQPDFAVLKPREDDYASATPSQADVLLLIEVADSSLDYDRGLKRRLYARSGIAEYWLVDVNAGVVEACRGPAGDAYETVWRAGPGDTLAIPGVEGASIAMSDLFG